MMLRSQITKIGLVRPIVNNITKRNFHSVYHADIPILDNKTLENKILSKAYNEYVPELGFNELSINKAISDLGYTSNNLHGLFNFTSNSRNFVMELVLYHLKYQRFKLIELQDKADTLSSETDKLKFYLENRLLGNGKIINHYHTALSYLISPLNIRQSLEELHNLSDDITYYSGDNSNDFAWYSKRFSVSGIFINCELFMLNDKSPNFERTIEFMNDRVNEMDNLGYAYNSFEEWAFFNAASTVNLIKSQLIKG